MAALTSWITNIIILLILAMILDMLLPNSELKKYVKLVTGLLLIVMIISPLFKLMSTDYHAMVSSLSDYFEYDDQLFNQSLEKKKSEIETSQHAYILEQQAVLMQKEVEKELIEQFEMEITQIQLTATMNDAPINEQLKNVQVFLTPQSDTLEVIKPVKIDVNDNPNEVNLNFDRISALLSDRWEIPQSIIEIIPRGGPE